MSKPQLPTAATIHDHVIAEVLRMGSTEVGVFAQLALARAPQHFALLHTGGKKLAGWSEIDAGPIEETLQV